jgi:hypothetical protein
MKYMRTLCRAAYPTYYPYFHYVLEAKLVTAAGGTLLFLSQRMGGEPSTNLSSSLNRGNRYEGIFNRRIAGFFMKRLAV